MGHRLGRMREAPLQQPTHQANTYLYETVSGQRQLHPAFGGTPKLVHRNVVTRQFRRTTPSGCRIFKNYWPRPPLPPIPSHPMKSLWQYSTTWRAAVCCSESGTRAARALQTACDSRQRERTDDAAVLAHLLHR